MRIWRLIVHGPVDGALNMALDRAVQLSRQEGSAPPTLRLYSWARPTVTLGRFQDPGGVDHHECVRQGIDVVRRFTGGRGVLHDDELTYSAVATTADGVPRGVTASYRHLCGALVEAYRALGVDADLTTRDRGEGSSSACYLQTTRADLSLGEHKLSGSAQVWFGSTVLQHGSFTVSRDIGREARVFRLDDAQSVHLAEVTTTVGQVLARRPSWSEIERAVIDGFRRGLGIELVPGDLSIRESELAVRFLGETQWDRIPERAVRA